VAGTALGEEHLFSCREGRVRTWQELKIFYSWSCVGNKK